ncbi:hypothetical protein J0J37_22415, partial [Vibrio vulnificus]|uniref:hypothetical protein n=1 Tax=Vibrio vulnificus TaxID=672 RepID=UPI0019D4C2EE
MGEEVENRKKEPPKKVVKANRMKDEENKELKWEWCEEARTYKDKIKAWGDHMSQKRNFQVGDKVLLYDPYYEIYQRKYRYRWTGPYK